MPLPQHRVWREYGAWYYRHYGREAPNAGPYKTRSEAMEALLNELGFKVETEE